MFPFENERNVRNVISPEYSPALQIEWSTLKVTIAYMTTIGVYFHINCLDRCSAMLFEAMFTKLSREITK